MPRKCPIELTSEKIQELLDVAKPRVNMSLKTAVRVFKKASYTEIADAVEYQHKGFGYGTKYCGEAYAWQAVFNTIMWLYSDKSYSTEAVRDIMDLPLYEQIYMPIAGASNTYPEVVRRNILRYIRRMISNGAGIDNLPATPEVSMRFFLYYEVLRTARRIMYADIDKYAAERTSTFWRGKS